MEYTTNLNLKKPDVNEYYNVEQNNENMDLIDEAVGELNKNIQNTTYIKSYTSDALFVKDSSGNEVIVPTSVSWGYVPVTKIYMTWHETNGWCLCVEFVYNNDRIVDYYVPLRSD